MTEISVGLNFFALSALFNGLAALGLGLFIYLRDPNDSRHVSFVYISVAASVWSIFYVAWQFSTTEEWALVFLRLLMAGAIFIPVTWLHHTLYVTGEMAEHRRFLQCNYGMGVVFLVMDFTPIFIEGVRPICGFLWWGIAGWGFTGCLIWWSGLVGYLWWLHWKAYRRSQGLERRQFLYLLVGTVVAYFGGATNFPLWYGIEILPYGTMTFSICMAFSAYAILRFHYLGFAIYVEEGVSYFTALLLISLPLYPLLLLSQELVLGELNPGLSLSQLVFYLFMVGGAYLVKMDSRGAVVRTLVKGREYRVQLLNRFFTHVVKIRETGLLGQAIVETMGKTMGVSKAALFALQVEQSRFQAIASIGCEPDEPVIMNGWSLLDELPQLLMYTQDRIGVPELKAMVKEEWEPRVGQELEAMGFAWCYPLFVNERLAGFLAFGPVAADALQGMGGEVIWKGMVHEATLALENAMLRDEVHRSETMLCQVDRLRSLRAMVHTLGEELQNPVSMVKTFVQLAGLRQNDEKFFRRLEGLVHDDFHRMEDLTKELSNYLQPLVTSLPTEVRVNDILDTCLWFLSTNPLYQHIMIRKKFTVGLPALVVDRQDLLQALFNGLLFLLQGRGMKTDTLLLKTYVCGEDDQAHLIIQMGWDSALVEGAYEVGSLSLEELDEVCVPNEDPTLSQGVIVGARLIQGVGGSLQALSVRGGIVGFEFQLSTRQGIQGRERVPLGSSQKIGIAGPESQPQHKTNRFWPPGG
ncbi:MAG: hypothetical protein OEY91_13565 [Nitrospirota bacterium]|nr:hypothetical protein [Nitrospirota bacterium]